MTTYITERKAAEDLLRKREGNCAKPISSPKQLWNLRRPATGTWKGTVDGVMMRHLHQRQSRTSGRCFGRATATLLRLFWFWKPLSRAPLTNRGSMPLVLPSASLILMVRF